MGSADFQQGAGLAVDLNVPERISTYVGAAGVRRGEIAFGALDPTGGGVTRDLVVTTQSTVPYDIDVAAHWGRLQRREGDPYGLNYGMRLSGVTVEPGSKLSCANARTSWPRPPVPGRTCSVSGGGHTSRRLFRCRDVDVHTARRPVVAVAVHAFALRRGPAPNLRAGPRQIRIRRSCLWAGLRY